MVDGPYQAGEEVWMKPPDARCDTRYKRGTVTRIVSNQAVDVDGVPRHVRDLRHCTSQGSQDEAVTTDSGDETLLIQLPAEDGVTEESGSEDDADVAEQALPRLLEDQEA